ncbi:MAG: ADP-ribosylglycohydrolase family protein [Candidatus Andersenbacteria bacterium]
MSWKNPKLLLYIAMADAYAAACEYLNADETYQVGEALSFNRYLRHPRLQHRAGQYTDDTEMSIANTKVLLRLPTGPWTTLDFANAYVEEFQYGGRRHGYARGFQGLLTECKDGTELLARVRAHSTKNGAAMRAVPCGVLASVQDVVRAAMVQAQVTHNTPSGILSAKAVALLTYFALYREEPFEEFRDFYRRCPLQNLGELEFMYARWFDTPIVPDVHEPFALTTVRVVFTLLRETDSLLEAMRRILRMGGDTDSVAAITWGILSCRHPFEQLPVFMEQGLEDGNPVTGPERLKSLSTQLMRIGKE